MARRRSVRPADGRQNSSLHSVTTSVASSAVTSIVPSRASSPGPQAQPFRFFDLPSELRLKVYERLLLLEEPLDLDPTNYRRILPRLALFLVCKRMHEEAYRIFYAQPMRLFPFSGRFFHTKRPLPSRLPTHYREAITTFVLRLGPGWSAPPRCQNTNNPALGLADCVNMRRLNIFIECDTSDSIFTGFRGKNATEDTYKWFCVDLLVGIFDNVPSLKTVEIDAFPSVKREAPIVMALKRKIREYGKALAWGPLRGWNKDGDEPGLIGLESAMAGMGISDTVGRIVEVQA